MITAALFPPSSRMVRPKRLLTISDTKRPTAVDPVKDMSGTRLSETRSEPTSAPPEQRVWMDLKPKVTKTSLMIRWTAMAQRQVVGAGFQIIMSPQMKARAAFQPATATGKLKAVMHPTRPRGFQASIMK